MNGEGFAECAGCGRSVGYLVVEFNQASGLPDVQQVGLWDSILDAEHEAETLRSQTAAVVGRRERYAVAEVVLIGDPR